MSADVMRSAWEASETFYGEKKALHSVRERVCPREGFELFSAKCGCCIRTHAPVQER